MKVVGVCRFSLVGQGDWKKFSQTSGMSETEFILHYCNEIFSPARLERRFETFEHITLQSIAGQSDRNFLFFVLASALMPKSYKQRLQDICTTVPQVRLQFFDPTSVISAQEEAFKAARLSYPEVIQFRLDDDDAISQRHIKFLKKFLIPISSRNVPCAMSFTDVIYSVIGRQKKEVYNWHSPFLGCGTALFHPTRSIYGFGHFALPKRVMALTVPFVNGLVTHNGTNDTEAISDKPLSRRQMRELTSDDINRIISLDLSFLKDHGLRLAGLKP